MLAGSRLRSFEAVYVIFELGERRSCENGFITQRAVDVESM